MKYKYKKMNIKLALFKKCKYFLGAIFIFYSFLNYLIKEDYIAYDEYCELTDNYIIMDLNSRQSVKLHPRAAIIHSISLKIDPGIDGNSSDYRTIIELLENGNLIDSWSISNNSILDNDGGAGHGHNFILNSEYKIDPQNEYYISIYTDARAEDQSMRIYLDNKGEIWTRLSYNWLSKDLMVKIFLMVGIIFIAIMVIGINMFKEKIELVYLCISIPVSILFIFILPPFHGADEAEHFIRIYSILQGDLLVPSNGIVNIPSNMLYKDYLNSYSPFIVLHNFFSYLAEDTNSTHTIINMALYSPIGYIFQIVGVYIGNLLSDNIYILFFAARFANAFSCIMIVYQSLKIIPYGKYIVAIISLFPMTIQLFSTVTLDGITIACIILLLAFCLQVENKKDLLTWKDYTILYLTVFMLSSCKVIYFIVGVMILIIPHRCFKSEKKEWIHKLVLLVGGLLISVIWIMIAVGYLSLTRGIRDGGSISGKLAYIIIHPISFIGNILNSIWADFHILFFDCIGLNLGSLDVKIPAILVLFSLMLLLFVYYHTQNTYTNLTISKMLGFLSLMLGAMTYVSLFVQWTKRMDIIEGMQGRYFLPILPLAIFSFLLQKNYERNLVLADTKNFKLNLSIFCMGIIDLMTIVSVFYFFNGK